MSEFGELLRHARAYKGVTLREAERATKISRHHLAALESEEFTELPPLTYARGIVRNYAEYLGLDPLMILAKFEDIHGQRSGGFRVVPAVKPLDIPSHWAPNFAIIAFMVVMSAVIFAWMYSAYFAPEDGTPTPEITAGSVNDSVPTATMDLATPAISYAEGGAEVTPTPMEMPSSDTPTAEPTIEPTEDTGVHQFVVMTTERVWVEVTVDGQTEISTTLEAGESRSFEGEQMVVTSGNAAFVEVSVDGVNQGVLGSTWDAYQTYPISD